MMILLRLLLAAVIGGVLGYERRQRGQPKAVGVAAMILVAVGSATYMLLAQQFSISDPVLCENSIHIFIRRTLFRPSQLTPSGYRWLLLSTLYIIEEP